MALFETSHVGTWPDGFDAGTFTVSEDDAARVAQAHADATWGPPAAIGPMLHVSGLDGHPYAYAIPFLIGADVFPSVADLLARIASLHRDLGMEPEAGHWATPAMTMQLDHEFGRFGTVYVSAQRHRGPILMTTNVLPTFFFMADLASVAASRAGDATETVGETRLGRLMFGNPHEEYVECVAPDRTLLLDSDSMALTEATAFDEVLGQLGDVPEEHDEHVEVAWRTALDDWPGDIDRDALTAGDTVVEIPQPRRMPPVNWTYWCAPTAWTMAFAYWDNYTPGSGTHLGRGKVVDYWFDHDPTMNNVPNLIDEIIDKTKTPPSWAGDAFDIVNAQGYNFSKSSITCNKGNHWGWGDITAEIKAGRPVVVGMMSRQTPTHNNHAMVIYGYRITTTGQRFYKLLNTWGTSWAAQSIELATGIWQDLPMIKMSAERLIPGDIGATIDNIVLTRPGGGDTLNRNFAYDIEWHVTGPAITRTSLFESLDGGRSWNTIVADVPTTQGKNAYRWVPQHEAPRSRVRIEGCTSNGSLVAGDGSRENVTIQTHPLNKWGGWLGLGRPGLELSGLSVGRNTDGRLELLATALDGNLWHRYQTAPASQSWVGWGSMGRPPGVWLRLAEVATNGDGRLEVIALGDDDCVWHRWQPQPSMGPWAGWSGLGRPPGVALRRLSVEANADGRLQVFAIGDDHQIWTSHQETAGSASWSNWACLGGPGAGVKLFSLDSAANTDGRIEIVVGGGTPSGTEFGLKNPKVWLFYQPVPNSTGAWPWLDMGHPTGGAALPVPAISRNADGRLEMFVSGLGGELRHRWQPAPGSGPWSGWASRGRPGIGESLLATLDVARGGDGRLEAFGLSARTGPGGRVDLDCRHIWQTKPSNGWSGWGSIGSPPGRSIEFIRAVVRDDGKLELFALSSEDNAVWHNVQG